jgi:hypothetical protein
MTKFSNPVRHFSIVDRQTVRAMGIAAALLAAGFAPIALRAQDPAAAPAPHVPRAAAHPVHHKPNPAQPAQAPASDPQPAAPAPAPEPELPKWPANLEPAKAAVTWDSQGLHIDAENSSLEQIMQEVSTATGVKVEGLNQDQRVFGVYGPGQARDVISQLLQGTGYNVLMVGDIGEGTPREIMLSIRPDPGAQSGVKGNTPNTNSEEDNADDDEPPAQPPMRPGFGPGGPMRTPQQMQQERQRMMQQRGITPPPGAPTPQNNPQN